MHIKYKGNIMNKVYTISFTEAQNVVVSGDIHGDFNQLVFKLCVQYHMKDTVLIVAGDCGFGFEKKEYYDQMTRHNAKRMNEANNWIVFVRGNHDNPLYFDGKQFNHKRFIAVPDYTILLACKHTILCVGGGISIDRRYRIEEWKKYCSKHRINTASEDLISKNFYWPNEAPIYNEEILTLINKQYAIDTVITHTAPNFCELTNKNGLLAFAVLDQNLLKDVEEERSIMTKLYDRLIYDAHPLKHWYYGHFHQSWLSSIEGVLFKMLDIMEFTSLFSVIS